MLLAFAIFLVLHGLIHVVGFVKAFGFADLPQLTRPVTPFGGVMWLAGAVLMLAAAGALFAWPRWWWAVAACALVVSMIVIVPAWTDAKFGALANAVVLAGIVFGFVSQGPASLRAAYDRDVKSQITSTKAAPVITDADLAHLPDPVQRYLRISGVVGQPRVENFRARMHGRIRSGPAATWIPFEAEQHNFLNPPSRMFYLTGSMYAIPVQGYHRYVGPAATMRVKAAAIVPVVDASGREMNQGETVTMFNDMCVMAPATLISQSISWEAVDARTAKATFTNAGQTIHADLFFNEAGELTNFMSKDRYQIPQKGAPRQLRWSTPLEDYRDFNGVHLASRGEARWLEAGGEYAYIALVLDDVQYNVTARDQ